MSAGWLFNNILAALLLPPGNGLLLVGLGWVLWHRRPRLARASVGLGAALLFLLSLPAAGDLLLRGLEGEPLNEMDARNAQAIVVLGGGRYREAPEYGGDTVGEATLARLRYAARLQRQTGLPLLVTGGRPDGAGLTEGETMRRVLEDEFRVPVRWVEAASDNTRENALLSAALLRPAGVSRVLLVTHAWHMPRSARAFAAAGLAVTPAPTFFQREPLTPLDFMPSAAGLRTSRFALHEWLGMLWYGLRG